MDPLERPADCDRFLIVVNPDSPLSVKAQLKIRSLLVAYGEERGGYGVETFSTEEDRDATQEKLIRDLQPRDLLVVSTGDGGLNMAAETLVKYPELREDGRNKTPILPIQGGYINLGRQQLMPGILDKSYLVEQALNHGSIIEVNPLEITLTSDGEAERRFIEVLCAGFGLTGGTIYHLENDARKSFREKNILTRELAGGIATVRAFMTVEPFTVERQEDGKVRSDSVRELSITNSERVGRFRFPIKLTDPEFLTTMVPEKRSQAGIALGRLLVRRPVVERVKGFDSYSVTLRTANGTKIKMQIGGESNEVSSGTNATVRRLQETVRFVSINPELQNVS